MKSLIAPVLLVLVLLGCAPDEVVLAKIADSEITEAELEQFVARLPKHLHSDEQGIAADREYLESMIDQELLLLEAKNRGLDTTAALVQQMEDAVRRRLALRYQREVIASKIDIGPKEIERAFHDMGFDRERLLNRIVVRRKPTGRAGRTRAARGRKSVHRPSERVIPQMTLRPTRTARSAGLGCPNSSTSGFRSASSSRCRSPNRC